MLRRCQPHLLTFLFIVFYQTDSKRWRLMLSPCLMSFFDGSSRGGGCCYITMVTRIVPIEDGK